MSENLKKELLGFTRKQTVPVDIIEPEDTKFAKVQKELKEYIDSKDEKILRLENKISECLTNLKQLLDFLNNEEAKCEEYKNKLAIEREKNRLIKNQEEVNYTKLELMQILKPIRDSINKIKSWKKDCDNQKKRYKINHCNTEASLKIRESEVYKDCISELEQSLNKILNKKGIKDN